MSVAYEATITRMSSSSPAVTRMLRCFLFAIQL